MRRRMMMTMAMAAAVVATASMGFVGEALADDCMGASLAKVVPKDATLVVDVRTSDVGWDARLRHEDGTGKSAWLPLEGVPKHGHIVVAGPLADGRFAVVRASAGHAPTDRVLLYRASVVTTRTQKAWKPLRSWSLADLLTAAEQDKVVRSISHIRWLAQDIPSREAVQLDVAGEAIDVKVVGGRTQRVSLRANR